MKSNSKHYVVVALAIIIFAMPVKAQTPKLNAKTVKAIISSMTLEEKVKLVVGTGMEFASMGIDKKDSPTPVVGNTEILVPGAAGTTFPVPHLGITPMVLADGPAGLRILPQRKDSKETYFCTAFPVATLLASTWDPQLVHKVGEAMGNEVHEYGADVLLAPAINIHRNPLCGRNFEYYSEDPLLTGLMSAAMIEGVQSQGVGTSIKHFAANNAETSRNRSNSIISQRALREIYLEGFRIAIQKANPWTVMSSYNYINGTYTSESYDLLTKILRDEWGFKGFVMTDWYGGKDAVAQMKAGNDMIMPGMPSQVDAIIAAVKNGSLEMKVLDKNVERILQILVLSPRFKQYPFSNKPDLKAHAVVARQAAADGIVLLKNNQSALPLATGIKKIAVFGNASYETYSGGTGSGDVNEAYTVNIAQGLVNAGFDVNKTLEQGYEKYILAEKAKQPKPANPLMALLMPPPPVPQMPVDPISPALLAAESDAAIITLGRNAGEGGDRKNIAGDFQLTQVEADMIEKVCDAFHAKTKKVIVILNIGGVIETASWREKPDAILLAWQGGQETGNAIADIITGKVNPSGKLATTFPLAYEDVPSSANFPGKILASQPASGGSGDQNEIIAAFFNPPPAEVVYEEGIYVGYRYFNSFGVKTAFPFGFGLSYTTFGYSALKLTSPEFNGKQLVSVTITNTGKVAGREVVQMYISAPAKAIDKPRMELKGFQKTKLLQPGESQTLNFTMDARSLSSFHTSTSAWVLEPGAYTINVGASIDDIKLNSQFTVKKQVITEKVNPVLAPQRVINELVRK